LALHRILINSFENSRVFSISNTKDSCRQQVKSNENEVKQEQLFLSFIWVILQKCPDSTSVIHGNEERLSDIF
jgi:hypothetical protein